MKLIPLTMGYSAQVDDADFQWALQWKWHTLVKPNKNKIFYAVRNRSLAEIAATPGAPKAIMHRELLGVVGGVVDHIDHDGLNNQRNNLRITTNQLNLVNNKRAPGKHGFKGVRSAPNNRFAGQIMRAGKQTYLGTFDTPEDAARARDAAALNEWGEFAKLNFPERLINK